MQIGSSESGIRGRNLQLLSVFGDGRVQLQLAARVKRARHLETEHEEGICVGHQGKPGNGGLPFGNRGLGGVKDDFRTIGAGDSERVAVTVGHPGVQKRHRVR